MDPTVGLPAKQAVNLALRQRRQDRLLFQAWDTDGGVTPLMRPFQECMRARAYVLTLTAETPVSSSSATWPLQYPLPGTAVLSAGIVQPAVPGLPTVFALTLFRVLPFADVFGVAPWQRLKRHHAMLDSRG